MPRVYIDLLPKYYYKTQYWQISSFAIILDIR